MKVSFVSIGEEAAAALDLNHIAHTDQDVEFPESVQISNDVEDEYSQPSYWMYQVGQERFVYPLDTQELVVE